MMIYDRLADPLAAVSPAATAEAVAAATAVIAAAYVPDVRITPLAGRIAAELGVDIATVHGSGSGGKIYADDVEKAFAARLPASAATEEISDETISGTARADEAQRDTVALIASGNDYAKVAAFTQHMEIDVTELLAFCAQTQITPTALYVKAMALCLLEFERFRMRFLETENRYVAVEGAFVGLQLNSADGVYTPVLQNADVKSPEEIAAEVAVLTEKVKRGGLSGGDVTGGTIALIDKGKSSVCSFTPVIPARETAVLGMGAPYERLVMTRKGIENRTFILQSLTFDQRVIGGVDADEFQLKLKEILETPVSLAG